MASSMGKFIFFLVSFSTIQIHARESKYFSKFIHYSTKESISDTPVGEPVATPAPAPAPVYTENNENGYGLYGHETGLFPPSKETSTPTTTIATTSTVTTTTSEDENELLNQELDSYTYEKGYQGNNYNNNGYTTNSYNNNGYNNNNYNKNTRLTSASYVTDNRNNNGYTTYNNNNGYQTNNYNNNGYETERQGMSDTKFMENGKYYYDVNNNNNNNNNNGYYTNNYNNNGYQTNNYNNNGYETERQGMSDTRFMESGKYYYDVNNENKHYPKTGYESEMTNTKYPNEFNTMEEYENYQESQNESGLP